MKKIIKPTLQFCIAALFLINICYSQDIIVLKNGDEIKSKVLEVSTNQVKYKKWGNQEGPTYSSIKSDIFMIKYSNGTKDVFNNNSNQASNTSPTNNSDVGGKYIGTWYPKNYDGNNIKTTLTVTKPGDDYLVTYKVLERGGGYDFMYNADGSFKEMGHIEGNSIVVNSFIKLSLMNDNTILMGSREYVKSSNVQQQTSSNSGQAIPSNIPTATSNYIGHYNPLYSDGDYNIVDNTLYYKSNKSKVKSVTFDVNGVIQDPKTSGLRFKSSQGSNQFLTANIVLNGGFKSINDKSYFAVSIFTAYEDGSEFDRKENMQWDSQSEPLEIKFVYNTPSLKPGSVNTHTFYYKIFDFKYRFRNIKF